MTSPERVAAAANSTTRWLGRLALIGAALFVAGLAMDSESVAMPAAFLVVGGTVGTFTLPVGLALAIGLRRPAALPDGWRSAAALVGLASVLFGLRDVDSFTATVESLLQDEDRRRRLGAAGRQHVLEHYTETRAAERLIACYRRFLDER